MWAQEMYANTQSLHTYTCNNINMLEITYAYLHRVASHIRTSEANLVDSLSLSVR